MRAPVLDPAPPARWSMRVRPPFVEAYPTLSVGEAVRELGQGREHLIWRDRYGNIAGIARVDRAGPDHLSVSYRLEEQPYLEPETGVLGLPLVWKGSQENNQRPFTGCPLCLASVDVLVFAGTWVCSKRHHGLRHRSACLSQVARWSEAVAELEAMLAVDSALGTAGKKPLKRVAERDALLGKLQGRWLDANALQLVVISREWVQPLVARRKT